MVAFFWFLMAKFVLSDVGPSRVTSSWSLGPICSWRVIMFLLMRLAFSLMWVFPTV